MATNVFFNNYDSFAEQTLAEDLVIESIKLHGFETFYMPRTLGAFDPLLNEDTGSQYNTANMVEMTMKPGGFGGRGDFLSLSGDMIQDTLTLVVSRRRFNEEVGDPELKLRPNEGDLVYFPLNRKVYKVMFVEHESVFYQSGDLPLYELNCELMEYTGEVFNTGFDFIDNITKAYEQNIQNIGNGINDETDDLPFVDEGFEGLDSAIHGQNDYYQKQGKKIIDFSEIDPFTSGDEY